MRVLHAAALLRPPIGVVNQMQWEQDAALLLQLPWDVRVFCPQGAMAASGICHYSDHVHAGQLRGVHKAAAWWALRREYYAWLSSQLTDYDVILLRYYPHDPLQLAFLRGASNPVYMVHHALEGPELAGAGGWMGKLRAALENVLGPKAIRAAAGIIGVTSEIVTYELVRARDEDKPTFIYPNGIMYDGAIIPDSRTDTPQLLFVASGFAPWHGLDLLLASIHQCQDDFVLHVVGDVSEVDKRAAQGDARIHFHGRLSHDEISALAARCVVGLSSLALDRNGMAEACTLKVRQYLMLGLPVYAGYKDVFPATFPYYRQGPCDVRAILEFAAEHARTSREVISVAAHGYIDKRELLRNMYEGLQRRRAGHV